MPLSIIGSGFGRTGTMSLYLALNELGFPCYHMQEFIKNRSHLDFWHKVANAPVGTQHNWEEVFANYTAAVDNPACCVWRELAEAHPDAKIVLSLHPRGPEAWYESTVDTIYFTETKWQFKVLTIATPFGRKFGDMLRKLVWQRSHQGTMNNRTKAIAHYMRHIEEVKLAVPKDRLLIFSVDQGWEPLCEFLGVPVPADEFPNVNDRAAFRKNIAGMTMAAYGILVVAALIACTAIYGAIHSRLF